jgi:hypothetical protein
MRTRCLPVLAAAGLAALLAGPAPAQTYRGYYQPSNYGNPPNRNYGNPPSRYYQPSNYGNPGAQPIQVAANTAGLLSAGSLVPTRMLPTLPAIPIGGGNTLINTATGGLSAVNPATGVPAGIPQVSAFVEPIPTTPTPENPATSPAETPGAGQPAPAATNGVTPEGLAAVGAFGAPVTTSGFGISPFAANAIPRAASVPAYAPAFAPMQSTYLGYPSGTTSFRAYSNSPGVVFAPTFAPTQYYPSTVTTPLRRVYGGGQ